MKRETKQKIIYVSVLFFIAVIFLIFWRWLGDVTGIKGYLTIDDLASVQFTMAGNNLFEKIKIITEHDPTNVPIFYIMLYIWIKLFGYFPNHMRLLTEIIGALFVVASGLIGNKIFNKRTGVIASIIAGSSIQVVYVSYQVRAYSLMVFFAAVVFYCWLCRNEKWRTIIVYAVSMLLLSYSHFFGVLLCAAFCSFDILNIILKKEKKKCLISYVIYIVCFLPYLIVSYINAMNVWGAFWPPVPDYRDIWIMLGELCPGGDVFVYLFGGVFFIYFVLLVNMIRDRKENPNFRTEIFGCFWNIFAVLTVIFIYSRYINPVSSLWVKRYLLVLFPFVITILAYGVEMIIIWSEKINISKAAIWGIILFLGFRYTYVNLEYEAEHKKEIIPGGKDYAKVTEYIVTSEEIKGNTSLVYLGYPEEYFAGWKEYASQGGKRQLPNLYNSKEGFLQLDLSGYDTIYVVDIVYEVTDEEKAYLEKTHQLVEENCDGDHYVDKYEKY